MTGTDLLARADRLRAQRTPFVLATVVRAEKPTSAKAGDRAIVLADGTIEGFVGGVCAESTVRLEGLRMLDAGGVEATLLRITPTETPDSTPSGSTPTGSTPTGSTPSGSTPTGSTPTDATAPGAGSTGPPASAEATPGLTIVANPCLSGGTLDIFLEAMLPATLLHVFGDAPIARALASLAQAAGYAVMSSTDPAQLPSPDTSAVVVASHGRDELAVLAAALRAGVPYVGLVASPRRGSAVVAELDVPDELRSRVRTPAGLDLGARTPVEVAVSIVAEIVKVRAQARPPAAHTVTGAPAPANAIDPVCGMSVAAVPSSQHLERDGTTWFFCGPGCRQAFADDPGRYGA